MNISEVMSISEGQTINVNGKEYSVRYNVPRGLGVADVITRIADGAFVNVTTPLYDYVSKSFAVRSIGRELYMIEIKTIVEFADEQNSWKLARLMPYGKLYKVGSRPNVPYATLVYSEARSSYNFITTLTVDYKVTVRLNGKLLDNREYSANTNGINTITKYSDIIAKLKKEYPNIEIWD